MPVIKDPNKKEYGQKPHQTRNPFPPVERSIQQQAQPKHQQHYNKGEIDQGTHCNDHPDVEHDHNPDQQKITDQSWAQNQKRHK